MHGRGGRWGCRIAPQGYRRPVIVHINHIARAKKQGTPLRQAESDLGALVTGCMMSMVEDGILDPQLAPSLR